MTRQNLLAIPVMAMLLWGGNASIVAVAQDHPVPPTALNSKDISALEQADNINEQAKQLYKAGRHGEAEFLFIQALKLYRETLGDRHQRVAIGLSNLAMSYTAQGQDLKAEYLYLEALEIHRELPENRYLKLHVAMILNELALLYAKQGLYSQAEPLLIENLEIHRETLGNRHPDVANSLISLSFLYHRQEMYKKAEPLYIEALEIRREVFGKRSLNESTILNKLGELYFKQGEYSKAEPIFKEDLEIRRKILGNRHPDVATSLNNLGLLYNSRGLYIKAESVLREALEIRRETLVSSHPDLAISLNALALLYEEQGLDSKAESLLLEALNIYRDNDDEQYKISAIIMNNLAILYGKQGKYSKAESLYLEALEIRRQILGERHLDVATSYVSLASLYSRKGLYIKAEPLYIKALEIYREAAWNNPIMLATALHHLALVYEHLNQHEKSDPLHIEALEMRREVLGDRHPDVAISLSDFALRLYEGGELKLAGKYFGESLEINEWNLGLNLAHLGESERQAYVDQVSSDTHFAISLHQTSASNSPEFAQLALTTLLRRKGRIQDVGTNNLKALRQNLTPDDQNTLDQLIALRQQMAALTYNPPNRSPQVNKEQFDQLVQQAQTLEAGLARRSAAFRAENKPVKIPAVQQQLPANSVLIEYASYRPYDTAANKYGPARYAAYLLFPDGRIESRDLGEATKIDTAIQAFSRGLRDPRHSLNKQSQTLEKLIIEPIRPLLSQSTQLLISPDSQLHTIPFEALQQDNNQYLIEQFQISYLNSGRDLLKFDRSPSSRNPAVIVANPDYALARSETQPVATRGELKRSTALKDLRFRPLPGTAEEANSLAKLLPNAQILTASNATENRIKQLQAPRILHIATHGFFLADTERAPAPNRGARTFASQDLLSLEPQDGLRSSPSTGIPVENPLLRSGLALAGFNPRQSGSEDGVLTALEASTLNLFGTDLVVLSACETGLGEIANGEGVYGLRRAFTIAGAETQVISLWQVDDFGTQSLMTQYYEQLLEGKGRSDAMRQSQLAMIESGTRYAHPYYWAPFIVSGDWRAMPQS